MRQLVINNPFRILGTFANVSTRDLLSNKTKLSRFLSVGRNLEFETDFSELFEEPINRTTKTVEDSFSMLSLDDDRFINALKWFVCVSDVDNQAFQYLKNGYVQMAAQLWEQSSLWSSSHNLLVLYLAQNRIRDAVKVAVPLYDEHLYEIKNCLCLNTLIDKKTIISDFINDALVSGCTHQEILDVCSIDWVRVFVKDKLHDSAYEDLQKKIESAEKQDLSCRVGSINEIISICKSYESDLKNKKDDLLQENHWQNIGNKILQCCIKTVNDYRKTITIADDETIKKFKTLGSEILSIFRILQGMNFSASVTNRLQENIVALEDIMKNVKEGVQISVALNDEICWFCGEHSTHKVTRPYKNYKSWTSGNTKYKQTYTKDIQINICEKCQKELDEIHRWHVIGFFVTLILEMAILFYFTCQDRYGNFEFNWSWLWATLIGNLFLWLVTLAVGRLIGNSLRFCFQNKQIRHFKQKESDHPAVKAAEKEGYNREGSISDHLNDLFS